MATKPNTELTVDEQKAKAFADGERTLEKGEAEVQDVIDQETAQGYRGVKVDPEPNESYTVAGVTAKFKK